MLKVDVKVEHVIRQWLDYLAKNRGYSRHTLKAYLTDIYYFLKFINTHYGQIITIELLDRLILSDFRGWLAMRKNLGHKTTSNSRALSVVRSFYRYLIKHHNFRDQAIFNIRIINKHTTLPRALSVNAALSTISAITYIFPGWCGQRDQAILMLLYGAGLRISEALALQVKDIPTLVNIPLVVMGKGSKERIIPLLPEVLEAINLYIKHCPYDLAIGTIFRGKSGKPLQASTFRYRLQQIRKYLNLPDYASPHAFRHSCATGLLANGGELRAIQELLGHQSISTTQRYTKVNPKNLIEAYLNSHPRSENTD